MKQAEKKKKSRIQIINAAIKLYAYAGGPEISLNELCRENNISKGKFYHYFSSKDELFKVSTNYIISELCKDIESYNVSSAKTIEENFKDYYSQRTKFWISHSDYFMILYDIVTNHDYEYKKQFVPLLEQYRSTLQYKTMEMIHTVNFEKKISDSELFDVIKSVFESMFIKDLYKIIITQRNGYETYAKKLSDDLLDFYSRLINVLLYGIFNKETPEDK